MKLVFGLGNPGKKYENTRHNVGFEFLDFISKHENVSFFEGKFNSMCAEFFIDDEKILLIKPCLFMNLSGEVIKKYIDFYKISLNDILIVQDDLDMNLGKIRVVFNSSSGGHNGVKNIIDNINSKEFIRLKIGIHNDIKENVIDYVLSKFDDNEKDIIYNSYIKLENFIYDFRIKKLDQLKSDYNGI